MGGELEATGHLRPGGLLGLAAAQALVHELPSEGLKDTLLVSGGHLWRPRGQRRGGEQYRTITSQIVTTSAPAQANSSAVPINGQPVRPAKRPDGPSKRNTHVRGSAAIAKR
jgi:hypothetical protein